MITETQTRVIVLQLTDELLTQLQPFMAGLDITIAPHNKGASQEVFARVEQRGQRLIMRVEVYVALAERVGSALDYDVRWQPNEYEPDGFVERVRLRPGGRLDLAGTPGRPDTGVSGRLFVCFAPALVLHLLMDLQNRTSPYSVGRQGSASRSPNARTRPVAQSHAGSCR